ncbi:uncharacterized protein BDW47DRAFT_100907 [Aspergillus candidus]|uniref:Uncharacterized protein n=1 Tax=Aspergillus candidus TaxID=41067 RepID=A0A2I2FJM0_ASPCN|nr:hypothetical protein BDW47DRAFT_100907 [Aspergillus candidus]PLB40819.1 hypothetical protein BDW47DRAFT_100907 [Aspergillus candidus]
MWYSHKSYVSGIRLILIKLAAYLTLARSFQAHGRNPNKFPIQRSSTVLPAVQPRYCPVTSNENGRILMGSYMVPTTELFSHEGFCAAGIPGVIGYQQYESWARSPPAQRSTFLIP